jgi:hypothetical protein
MFIKRVPQCTVCPLVGIRTLPTPLLSASVPLPPELGGGGRHWVGGVPSPTTGEKAEHSAYSENLTIRQCIQYDQNIKTSWKQTFWLLLLLLVTLLMFASLQLPVLVFLLLTLLMLQAGGGRHGDTSWCCQGKFIMILFNMGILTFRSRLMTNLLAG